MTRAALWLGEAACRLVAALGSLVLVVLMVVTVALAAVLIGVVSVADELERRR